MQPLGKQVAAQGAPVCNFRCAASRVHALQSARVELRQMHAKEVLQRSEVRVAKRPREVLVKHLGVLDAVREEVQQLLVRVPPRLNRSHKRSSVRGSKVQLLVVAGELLHLSLVIHTVPQFTLLRHIHHPRLQRPVCLQQRQPHQVNHRYSVARTKGGKVVQPCFRHVVVLDLDQGVRLVRMAGRARLAERRRYSRRHVRKRAPRRVQHLEALSAPVQKHFVMLQPEEEEEEEEEGEEEEEEEDDDDDEGARAERRGKITMGCYF